ncbi:MAG TPA: hypothetical protein VHV29_03465, partial [Terriglobales bacterium]|nr:hypothetical protein [Terriglobales bacterium]
MTHRNPLSHANNIPVDPNATVQFSVTGVNTAAEQQPAPLAQFRLVTICFLAAGIGLLAGAIAFLLYKLIGLLT